MSDKNDDKIGEQSEDENTNTNVKKEKKRKKKNKSKKNKTEPKNIDSGDDVYDISPAKDRPWSPGMAQRETVVTAYKQIGSYNRFALSHGSMEESDEERQDKGRKIGRKNGSKATIQKEKKSLNAYQGMRNDGMGSQKEIEIGKSAARTTSTGIGGLVTQRELNGHVNTGMINVQPVYAEREIHCKGVLETERYSSISNINSPVFQNINGQSSENSVHVAAKTTMIEVKDDTTDILPCETATHDKLKRNITAILTDGPQSDKQIKKKRKKKGKKQKNELQSEPRKCIIVDQGMFPLENEKKNIVTSKNENESKTTSSTSQNDKPISHIIDNIKENDGNDLAHENDKENADANESKPTKNKSQSDALLFPIIEDIEYNIEDEFLGNAEDEILTADSFGNIDQDPLVQNEDLPATLSSLNLNWDCRACVGEVDVPSTNNTERTDQPIGRFRKLLNFLTCCFTSKVED